MKTETKTGILILVVLIVILIFMHGMELGTFYKTSDNMYRLWGVYYLLTVATAFLYVVRYKKLFAKDSPRQKAKHYVILLFLCAIPSFLLLGPTGYIDYYTTNKHWKAIEVSVRDNSHHSSGKISEYSYKLVGKDTVLYLDSKTSLKNFETFTIEICTTRLGNVVANIKYLRKT